MTNAAPRDTFVEEFGQGEWVQRSRNSCGCRLRMNVNLANLVVVERKLPL